MVQPGAEKQPEGGAGAPRGRVVAGDRIARGHCSATAKIPPTGVDAVMTIP